MEKIVFKSIKTFGMIIFIGIFVSFMSFALFADEVNGGAAGGSETPNTIEAVENHEVSLPVEGEGAETASKLESNMSSEESGEPVSETSVNTEIYGNPVETESPSDTGVSNKTPADNSEGLNNEDDVVVSLPNDEPASGTDPKVMLLTSILCGDVKTAENIVKNRINLNFKDSAGLTPLHYAICFEYAELARLMINNGANINARDLQGYSPLHYVCQIGNEEIFNLLLKRGAKLDTVANDGVTLLHLAAYGGNINIIKTLVSKGAKVSDKDANGLVPLDYAVIFQHKEASAYLAGITPNEFIGVNSVVPAVLLGDSEILKLILGKVADVNKFNTEEDALCWAAAANSDLEIFKILEEAGLNISYASSTGKNSLHFAAEAGNMSIITYLLEKGFIIDSVDSYNGYTPCMYACVNGNVDAFKMLADKGADLKIQNKKGASLIHEAAYSGNVEAVIFLMEKGVDINFKDAKGLSPLLYACDAGKLGMAVFLLESGADVHIASENGNTALHYAVLSDNKDIFNIVMNALPDVNARNSEGITPLHYASMLGNMDMIRGLIKTGARFTAIDEDGNNMLHYAAMGNLSAVSFFLTLGVKADLMNNTSETPMMIAEKNGKEDVIYALKKNLEKNKELP